MVDDEPILIEQGRSFVFLTSLENDVPVGFLRDWTGKAQLRRANNHQPSGLIADLTLDIVDANVSNDFVIYHLDTSLWPLGLAEMDVQFSRSDSPFKIPTRIVSFKIIRSVTR